MNAHLLADTLAMYQARLRRNDLPLSVHRFHNVDVVVFAVGVHVIEDGLPMTRRPVGPELAAMLIETA